MPMRTIVVTMSNSHAMLPPDGASLSNAPSTLPRAIARFEHALDGSIDAPSLLNSSSNPVLRR
jgi:hypothetical protein